MIGLTESPSSLLKWSLFAPEVADVVETYEQNILDVSPELGESHHADSESARILFCKDKTSLEEYFKSAGRTSLPLQLACETL